VPDVDLTAGDDVFQDLSSVFHSVTSTPAAERRQPEKRVCCHLADDIVKQQLMIRTLIAFISTRIWSALEIRMAILTFLCDLPLRLGVFVQATIPRTR